MQITPVFSIALQPDGKILTGGYFTTIGGATRNGIARLNTAGYADVSFIFMQVTVFCCRSSAGRNDPGRGYFTTIGGVTRNHIARLNSNSTVDTSFDPNANSFIASIVMQPDEKILLGGCFTSIGGLERNHIARLDRTAPSIQRLTPMQMTLLMQSWCSRTEKSS